ncbi:phosphatidylinositol kinase-related protein kinase tor1, partial [Marasmius crinis-equi]
VLGKILRTEPAQAVRREVVKVLGILGAVDPYRRKERNVEDSAHEIAVMAVNQVPINQRTLTSASDDYFQTVVITALLVVLKDPALAGHHHAVIEAIMSIFKTQGLKSVAFLPQIIPAFTSVTRTSSARYQEFHLQQLAILVGILKQHIRNYTPDLFKLINDLWENVTLQLPIVALIEALGKALSSEFKPFLPGIVPLVLKVFEGEPTEKKATTQMKVLDALQTFGSNIEEYLHLVIPVIVRTYERIDGSTPLRRRAIQTIDGLSKRVNFSDHASRIVHPLVRVLDNGNNDLRMAVMDALCSLAIQLGSDFAIFVPTINKALLRNRITHAKYEGLISKLLNGERLIQETGAFDLLNNEASKISEYSTPAEAAKMTVNQQHLKQAWDVSQVTTREDWNSWMHRLSVEFMKESPSHALRACMSLVDIHPPLAKELFNAAFISCWVELYDQYQEDLVRSIETAISSPTAPSDLIHRWLNLAEFMEHEEKPLPIEHRTLGEYSLKILAYAKALHYKELEFFSDASPSTIEALITINTRLQQHDAAWGTLIMARETYDVTRHEEWYERLGRWQEALQVYNKKAEMDPHAPGVQIGRMKCLHALGEWDQLASQVDDIWDHANPEDRREIGPIAAAAAWSLNEWDSMDDYIATMRSDSPDRAFYRAILSIHQNQFSKAFVHIAKARDLLEPELTSFVGEGYVSSYNIMVRAQMLSELEEIIAYKQSADQPDRQATMRKTWMRRLQGCQKDVEVWQRILQVRTLVLKPEEAPQMWIKFANLCRKSDRMILAEKTIESLLSPPSLDKAHHPREQQGLKAPPDVVYAHLKYLWASGAQEESLNYLRQFSNKVARDLQTELEHPRNPSKQRNEQLIKLLARCYFKLGEWQVQRNDSWGSRLVPDILSCYVHATRYDPEWYKAWHTWALANIEVVNHLDNQLENGMNNVHPTTVAEHAVQAIEGLFQSILLRNQDSLQDTLRLLTLWFKFGQHDNVSNAMSQGFAKVGIDTWLHVLPQIIARIQTPNTLIRRTIQSVLISIGKYHPQALIYPLTVASKSSSEARAAAAMRIMEEMRDHSMAIVEQALVVSHEIIRIAILWHEQWHEGLEEASRLYFTEKNPEGMIAVLEPLHAKLEEGPQTARETSFAQVFGRELAEAREACRRYRIRGDTSELDKAWDIYYAVFKKIEKQLPQLTTLDLQYVSPILLATRNLSLAVPGTYQSGREAITILGFGQKLTVIASKQRPRRFSLKGNDGREYQYLLKGHEDLRQDERVMQLFSLVNNLLSVDTSSYMRRLHIQRYPVIPLAPNAGLIGFVQASDTLHVLVRDYRESRKMAPDYENLTLLQKVEVFEYALENTTGQDLYRVLWLKSQNSEHWLERRVSYTRSLAVNSMVGHILGLGDRHPSNILVERSTGKVINIDFGDCFEIATLRDKFPETVPFRLTRMLTHAMEVGGIEGSFRNTCEITMKVLRDNKESLLAVLEAFVYDPLISWRLMQTNENKRIEDGDTTTELARAAAHPQGPGRRKMRADENDIFGEAGGASAVGEALGREVRDHRAVSVYERVQKKLTGRDFDPDVSLPVKLQVDKLILQATSLENLCQLFSGWTNPKHLGSTYLKSENQTLWHRNAQRKTKQLQEEGPQQQETRRGSQVVVVHLGSRYLRVGKASDVNPVTVPNVVARKTNPPVPAPSFTEGICRPRKGKKTRRRDSDPEKDEYDASVSSEDPFDEKLAAITSLLRDRMRFYKLRVTPNASNIATTFNEQFKPEYIQEHNDPYRVDWIHGGEEKVLVGEKALRIADPQASNYVVRWPIHGPSFNTRDYSSKQMVLNDIESILRDTLKERLQIEPGDYNKYSVVLVIPDLYDRSYVRDLAHLLLVSMGFKQLCAQQESLAATYGAGISSACVVDIGAKTTSIACVDEGLVISDTRMTLNFGGDDITELFYVLLERIGFPYREANLVRSYDWNVIDTLKCKGYSQVDVALNLYDFVVRKPGQPAEKYGLRTYDEIILAPMAVFEPRVIEFDKKWAAFAELPNTDVTEEIIEHSSDHITDATPGATADGESAAPVPAENSTEVPMEVVDIEDDSKSSVAQQSPSKSVTKPSTPEPSSTFSGGFGIDVFFEASKLPLDVAIYNSARAAGGDEKIRKYLQAVLVVGGTASISGMAHALDSRLQAISTPLVSNMEKVQIIPPPKDVDPQVLVWKGAAVLGKMDGASELWVTPQDWDVFGMRGLKERCFYL